MSREIAEVRTDYIDDDNFTYIDVFFTDDDMEQGETPVIVCNDTLKVIWRDTNYISNNKVRRNVKHVLEVLFQDKLSRACI